MIENIKPFLFLLLIGTLLIACNEEKQNNNSLSASTVENSDKTQTVEVIKPVNNSFNEGVEITGTALPNQMVMVRSMESGVLITINKDIGDYVQKGTVIAILQNPELEQLVMDASAAAQMGAAEIQTLEAELIGAKANYKAKLSMYKRLKSVFEKTPQLTPISEVEKLEGDELIGLGLVSTLESKIKAKQHQNNALQKRIEIANIRKNSLSIKAPFSGIITQRYVDVGAMVQSGINNQNAKALFEIQDTNPIRLTIPIPESDASAITKGMNVSVYFPELLGSVFKSKISRISGVLDVQSKSMKVQIDIPNPKGEILVGMYAKATLQLGSRSDVLSLPFTAQIMYEDAPTIFVVKDGIVVRESIRKGLVGKDFFEILNTNINKETLVITKGKNLVKEGQKVKSILFKG